MTWLPPMSGFPLCPHSADHPPLRAPSADLADAPSPAVSLR